MNICQGPEKVFSDIIDIQGKKLDIVILHKEKHVFKELLALFLDIVLWDKL